jgi:hypothetical protein
MPRLVVDIEVDHVEPSDGDRLRVTGTVAPAGGPEVGFVGWVALLALLQRAVSEPAALASQDGQ